MARLTIAWARIAAIASRLQCEDCVSLDTANPFQKRAVAIATQSEVNRSTLHHTRKPLTRACAASTHSSIAHPHCTQRSASAANSASLLSVSPTANTSPPTIARISCVPTIVALFSAIEMQRWQRVVSRRTLRRLLSTTS